MVKVLSVDSDQGFLIATSELLTRKFGDVSCEITTDRSSISAYAAQQTYDIIIATFILPAEEKECFYLTSALRSLSPNSVFIILYDANDIATRFVIKSLKSGAYDLIKRADREQLLSSVAQAIEDLKKNKNGNSPAGTDTSVWQDSFESLAYPYAVTDTEGTIKRANRAFRNLVRDEWANAGNNNISMLIPAVHIDTQKDYPYQAFDAQSNVTFCFYKQRWYKRVTGQIHSRDEDRDELSHVYEDITGLLELERLLQESERRYHGFFDTLAIGICFIDAEFYIKDINFTACTILGIKKNTALSQSLDSLKLISVINLITPFIFNLEQDPAKGKLCTVNRIDNNKEITLNVTVQPVMDKNQKTASYFFVIFEDVSAQTKTKKDLLASEIRYHQLLDIVPVGIIVLAEGVIKFCNRRVANFFGIESVETMHNKPFEHFMGNNEEFGSLFPGVDTKPEKLPIFPVQTRIRKNNGNYIDIEVNTSQIIYANEHATLVVLQDVSDRVANDLIRQNNEEQLKAIYQSAPITMMVVDKDFCVRDINSLGRGHGDAVNAELKRPCESKMINCEMCAADMSIKGHKKQCSHCNFRSAILGTLHTGLAVHNREITIPREEGGETRLSTYLLHATRISHNEEFLCLVVLNDISEIKKTQDELTKAVAALKLAQERNKRHSRWINALYTVSRSISQSKDLSSMVSTALDFLEKQFHFKCACVVFPDKDERINIVQGISKRGADINTRLGVVPGERFDSRVFPDFFSRFESGKVETFSIFDDTLKGVEYWDQFKMSLFEGRTHLLRKNTVRHGPYQARHAFPRV